MLEWGVSLKVTDSRSIDGTRKLQAAPQDAAPTAFCTSHCNDLLSHRLRRYPKCWCNIWCKFVLLAQARKVRHLLLSVQTVSAAGELAMGISCFDLTCFGVCKIGCENERTNERLKTCHQKIVIARWTGDSITKNPCTRARPYLRPLRKQSDFLSRARTTKPRLLHLSITFCLNEQSCTS